MAELVGEMTYHYENNVLYTSQSLYKLNHLFLHTPCLVACLHELFGKLVCKAETESSLPAIGDLV